MKQNYKKLGGGSPAAIKGMFAVLLTFSVLVLPAQQKAYTLRGTVLEQGSGTTSLQGLGYATISIPSLSVGTIAAKDGSFELRNVPAGKVSLSIQSLGMVSVDTTLNVSGDISGLRFVLRDDNFRLDEVTVTATSNAAGASTSSLISRTAMDHMQATSIADVLSLLPGNQKTNGDLILSGVISLRSTPWFSANPSVGYRESEVADMASLGTAIISDGAPISNNANMQMLRPVIPGGSTENSGISGVASATTGADMRNI